MDKDALLLEKGFFFHQKGEIDDALTIYNQLIEKYPTHPNILHLIGQIAHQKKDFKKAISFIQNAILNGGNQAPYFYNLGNSFLENNQPDEAIQAFQESIKKDPNYLNAYKGLGLAYLSKKIYTKAREFLLIAKNIDPKDADLSHNLGLAHFYCMEIEQSIYEFMRTNELLISKNHNNQEAHFNLGYYQLSLEDFENGWKNYKHRDKEKFYFEPILQFISQLTTWDGSSLQNKTILILGEQGLADRIIFSTMLNEILMRSKKVYYCDFELRLYPIFERTWNKLNCLYPENLNIDILKKEIDFYAFMGDLGSNLRNNKNQFPTCITPFSPNKRLANDLSKKYRALAGNKKLIGVSWHGGALNKDIMLEYSIPLKEWAPILNQEHCFFISLQYFLDKSMLSLIPNSIYVDESIDPIHDFDNFCAQVSVLDQIISVDNTTVPVGGAFNIPTWLLTTAMGSWCWTLYSRQSLWFPSVQIFKKKSIDSWKEVIHDVSLLLKNI